MFVHEIVHECQYTIADTFFVSYPDEIQAMLIFDSCSQKYNFYVVYNTEIAFPAIPEEVVKLKIPLPLEVAQNAFPKFNLTEENYGF